MMLLISVTVKQVWKTIRSLLFNEILNGSNLPKETVGVIKANFYNIILRIMIMIITIERNERIISFYAETAYLKMS